MALLTYNGFGSAGDTGFAWDTIETDTFDTDPVFAEDGISHYATRYTWRGRATISRNNAADFKATIINAQTLLNRPRASLVLQYGAQEFSGTEPDILDGPQTTFKIQRIVNALVAIVFFEIVWHDYPVTTSPAETLQDTLSHRWFQQFRVQNNGLQIRTTIGTLIVRANADDTGSGEGDAGRNPDAYRIAVTPELLDGFRREQALYATDETGNRLIYAIEDREYPRDLPLPATVARGSFTWKRSMATDGGSALGIKTMEVELEGPRSVSPADLVVAALAVIRNRVNFGTGPGKDMILEWEVSEPALFTENRIVLRVVAQTIGSGGDGELAPPSFDLLSQIMSKLEGYEAPNPYGDALIRSVRRALYTPVTTTIPKAEAEEAFVGKEQAYQFDDATFSQLMETVESGGEEQNEQHAEFPYVGVQVNERYTVVDSGMRWAKVNSSRRSDRSFQVVSPTVFFESEGILMRKGKPPDRNFTFPPPGSINRMDEFKVGVGRLDQNQSKIFIAKFKRIYELGRVSGASNGFREVEGGISQWWPDGDRVVMGPDPRTTTGHVYPVGPPLPVRI